MITFAQPPTAEEAKPVEPTRRPVSFAQVPAAAQDLSTADILYRDPHRDDGWHRGDQSRWAVYNVSPADFRKLLAAQDFRCFLCRSPLQKQPRKSVVDHCHETGEVRAVLCQSCNTRIGGDKGDWILQAAAYLTSPPPARSVIGARVANGNPRDPGHAASRTDLPPYVDSMAA